MTNPLQAAGAAPHKQTRYAPINVNRLFTGLWTQRSPLREGATPYLYEKFYSGSRNDSLWDDGTGTFSKNTEISNKLTLVRRPGLTVYNTASLVDADGYYSFHTADGSVRVIADTASAVHDITSALDNSYDKILAYKAQATSITWGSSILADNPSSNGILYYRLIVTLGDGTVVGSNEIAVSWLADHKAVIVVPTVTGASDYRLYFGRIPGQESNWFSTGPGTIVAVSDGPNYAGQYTLGAIPSFVSGGGGQTHCQAVGNTLYMGDGASARKFIYPSTAWAASTAFASGTVIRDTNGNLQVAVGTTNATAQQVRITSNVCTLTLTNQVSFYVIPGVTIALSGFTTSTFLNGQSATVTGRTYNQVTFAFTHADVNTTETGSVATGIGSTGSVQPTWSTTVNGVTTDGTLQWICRGSSVQPWGIAASTTAPTVANTPRPSAYPTWAASTFYSPSLVLKDSNGNLQKLTTAGTTGAAEPTWNVTLGGTTADNTAVWTNVGTASWVATHGYAANDIVDVTFSYWVTVPSSGCFSGNTELKTLDGARRFDSLPETLWVQTENGLRLADVLVHEYDGLVIEIGNGWLVTPAHRFKRGSEYVPASDAFAEHQTRHFSGTVYNLSVRTDRESERHYILANGEVAHNSKASDPSDDNSFSYQVTSTAFFQCTTSGTSGSTQPSWIDGNGSSVDDGTVLWTNIGAEVTWATIGASTAVSNASIVLDSTGNKQAIATPGKSGSTAPTWATTLGQSTADGTAVWTNQGAFSGANTGAWTYSYSGLNSVTGNCSTESPVSSQTVLAANDVISVQGTSFTDTQVDRIRIWRTVQGGSTRLFLDDILNPGSGMWTYSDITSDTGLNEFIQAPGSSSNNPPQASIKALTYHLGRMWGAVSNIVYYTRVSDATTGVTTECFPPDNFFQFPSQVTRLWPCSLGLLVFTVSDIYLISGSTSSTLYASPFVQGIGLKSYNAFDVNGSIAYLFTSDAQLLMFDPSSGISEIGFPIGDVLSTWDASAVYLTWHVSGSKDKALYATDGSGSCYRMTPTSAPETGLMWNPLAQYAVPIKVIQSVETLPGTRTLLYGASGTGQTLKRDLSFFSDAGASYVSYATIGSIVLAQPGQVAEVAFITTDAMAVGSRMTIGVLLDEISGTFQTLNSYVSDPPRLATSVTTFAGRYYLNQTQQPAHCRHMMVKFTWPSTDTVQNELLAYCIFGAYRQEK